MTWCECFLKRRLLPELNTHTLSRPFPTLAVVIAILCSRGATLAMSAALLTEMAARSI